ncbi:MAG: DUF429 domain-containing protein [Myxococcales bacterium]|nr:DUF429 domain-containing protein [Myxococcales bacterium]
MTLIGIDAATQLANVGLALGHWHTDGLQLQQAFGAKELQPGARGTPAMVEAVSRWVAQAMAASDGPTLLAVDAPLGWPAALADALSGHQAGTALPGVDDPDLLFQRHCDQAIRQRLGLKPLEVGADRIARAAYAALALVQRIRERSGEPVPLGSEPGPSDVSQVIEVYPKATMTVICGTVAPYKATTPEHARQRQRLLRGLVEHGGCQVPQELRAAATASDHVLDAIACVVAGADFLSGKAPPIPEASASSARREGWIWVRSPS